MFGSYRLAKLLPEGGRYRSWGTTGDIVFGTLARTGRRRSWRQPANGTHRRGAETKRPYLDGKTSLKQALSALVRDAR